MPITAMVDVLDINGLDYSDVIAFIGQFGVYVNGNIVNNVAKEECLKYPHSLLTPYFVQVR